MNAQIITCIAILVVALILFVTEVCPLSITAIMVALSLCLTGILTPEEAFAGFVNSSVILFVGMFVISGALFHTGMAHRIAGLVTRFNSSERSMIVAIYALSGLLSAVLPNLGTLAVLLPIVVGISDQSKFKRSRLLMSLLLGATIGGQVTLLGTAGNAVIASALDEIGIHIGFFAFTKFGFPMFVVCGFFLYVIGYRCLPDRESSVSLSVQNHTAATSKQTNWRQYTSLAALLFVLVCAIFDIGIPLYVSSVIGSVFLLITRTIDENAAISSINWKAAFLIGGMLSMGTAFAKTGADQLIAETTIALLGESPSPLIITAVIWWLSNILSQLISNTAVILLLTPIGIAIAQGLQANPTAVLMAILTGCSIDLLTPIGSSVNTMIYEIGGYKFRDYFTSGIGPTLICFLVCIVLLPVLFPYY